MVEGEAWPCLYFLNFHEINELMTFPKFLVKSCYWISFLLSFQANLLLFIFFWQYINFWEFIHLTMTHHCLCSMDKRGGLHNWKLYQWSPKGVLEVARRKRMSDIRRRIPKSIRHRWNRLTLSAQSTLKLLCVIHVIRDTPLSFHCSLTVLNIWFMLIAEATETEIQFPASIFLLLNPSPSSSGQTNDHF